MHHKGINRKIFLLIFKSKKGLKRQKIDSEVPFDKKQVDNALYQMMNKEIRRDAEGFYKSNVSEIPSKWA